MSSPTDNNAPTRKSSRRPKRSVVELMEAFEAKQEQPQHAHLSGPEMEKHLERQARAKARAEAEVNAKLTKALEKTRAPSKVGTNQYTPRPVGQSPFGNVGTKWSEEETARLVQGLHIYGKSWNDIARLVGNRTGVQCKTKNQKMERKHGDDWAEKAWEAAGMSEAGKSNRTRGFTALPNGRFDARVRYGGKQHYVGNFKTAAEASAVYQMVRDMLDDPNFRAKDDPESRFEAARHEAVSKIPTYTMDMIEKTAAKAAGKAAAGTTARRTTGGSKEAKSSVGRPTKQPRTECDWKEAIDESTGKPYYYHATTNEVTWDKPAALMTTPPKKPNSSPRTFPGSNQPSPSSSSTSRGRFPRGVTLQASGSFQGRYRQRNVGSFATADEASRACEMVRSLYDNPTFLSDESADDRFEAARQKALEAVGKKVKAGRKTDTSNQSANDSSDWKKTIDEATGKPYYYHAVTNEVTWDMPAGFVDDDFVDEEKKSGD